ncbi:hypothetical protein HMPREF6485_1899 [Segatella buccae ATCC 33574]|uniref:Uncharacterized protein n=1 Tax=Segatella buccae ATCC 33574 TaxID=873513 RepID=E6K8G2_9BACT|nr:hypothetical protein HMPREF6485_1899 [Segatella buccae ATCC 33574]
MKNDSKQCHYDSFFHRMRAFSYLIIICFCKCRQNFQKLQIKQEIRQQRKDYFPQSYSLFL